ncbi:MAG TPA: hypothetical protein VGB64_03390 [Actinomycetota bacterium]
MIVRCGRCRAELEIAAPGEFLCPACGTRNAVRGAPGDAAPPASPFGAAGGLTIPGAGTLPPPPAAPDPNIEWDVCPACRWRFAHGPADTLTCPSCLASLSAGPGGLQVQA